MNTDITLMKLKGDIKELNQKIQSLENVLKSFLDIYYRTNFPDKEVMMKDLVIFKKNLIFEGEAGININSTSGLKVGNKTTDKIGFLGNTPVVKQTATTLTDVINALKNYGLLS